MFLVFRKVGCEMCDFNIMLLSWFLRLSWLKGNFEVKLSIL